MPEFLFQKLCIIGFGMIGSSVARAALSAGVAADITGGDTNAQHCDYVVLNELASRCTTDLAAAVTDADLVMICVPVRSYAAVMRQIASALPPGCIISDVGSVKQSVIRDIGPLLPPGVEFVPGHPIAGRERHGPQNGEGSIFYNRWCVLTPTPITSLAATEKLTQFWRALGSQVEIMTPEHHDRVLAITSHLPQLIARTIVGTAADLEDEIQDEVIKFSAGGFRDFTRMAAADPVMWRDIFLENSDAVLEMLQRLGEDLSVLQKAIRGGDGQKLQDIFTRAQGIRARVIEARQD